MEKGWIKLHRDLVDWEWYTDTNTKVLFIHLLIRCNHAPKKWKGKTINPGEIIVGIEEFGKEIGLSRQQTRTALSKLKSTNEITISGNTSFSLLKVNKWLEYQSGNQADNQTITKEQPNDNQTITTTKECKNVKNEKNVKEERETPAKKMQEFLNSVKTKNSQYERLVASLVEEGIEEDLIVRELDKFANYWSELTLSGDKQLWQTKKTFEVQRRLTTWFSNVPRFGGTNKGRGVTIIS